VSLNESKAIAPQFDYILHDPSPNHKHTLWFSGINPEKTGFTASPYS